YTDVNAQSFGRARSISRQRVAQPSPLAPSDALGSTMPGSDSLGRADTASPEGTAAAGVELGSGSVEPSAVAGVGQSAVKTRLARRYVGIGAGVALLVALGVAGRGKLGKTAPPLARPAPSVDLPAKPPPPPPRVEMVPAATVPAVAVPAPAE